MPDPCLVCTSYNDRRRELQDLNLPGMLTVATRRHFEHRIDAHVTPALHELTIALNRTAQAVARLLITFIPAAADRAVLAQDERRLRTLQEQADQELEALDGS